MNCRGVRGGWRIGLACGLGAVLMASPAAAQLGTPLPLPALVGARQVLAAPAARPDQTFSYGPADTQVAELFLPRKVAADARLPVVVTIHGGCWRSDFPGRELMRAAAAGLIAKGFAVWNIGYRRIGEDGGGYPGTYADVAAAIDLLRDKAEDYQLDPGNVVFFGAAAGGQLALWAAARPRINASAGTSPLAGADPLRPRGVVAFGALADLEASAEAINQHCGPGTAGALVGEADDSRPSVYADTSPAALLPTGVPVIMLHGVYDDIAPPAAGLAYVTAARKAGDWAEVQLAPQAGHFEGILPGTATFSQAVAAIRRFVKP